MQRQGSQYWPHTHNCRAQCIGKMWTPCYKVIENFKTSENRNLLYVGPLWLQRSHGCEARTHKREQAGERGSQGRSQGPQGQAQDSVFFDQFLGHSGCWIEKCLEGRQTEELLVRGEGARQPAEACRPQGSGWSSTSLGLAWFSLWREKECDIHPLDGQNAGAGIRALEAFHGQFARPFSTDLLEAGRRARLVLRSKAKEEGRHIV